MEESYYLIYFGLPLCIIILIFHFFAKSLDIEFLFFMLLIANSLIYFNFVRRTDFNNATEYFLVLITFILMLALLGIHLFLFITGFPHTFSMLSLQNNLFIMAYFISGAAVISNILLLFSLIQPPR